MKKVSRKGLLIICVMSFIVLCLGVAIVVMNIKTDNASHYVTLNGDGDSNEHVVNQDGSASHVQSTSVKEEWASYAKVQLTRMNGGDVHLFSNNKEFGVIPANNISDDDSIKLRYYMINDEDAVDVYNDVVSLTIDNFQTTGGLAAIMMVYQTDRGDIDSETGEKLKNQTTYSVFSNNFTSIDYKYNEYVMCHDAVGQFNLSFDTSDRKLNDMLNCNHIVFMGDTVGKTDIKVVFDGDNIKFISSADISNLSCNFTYDGSSGDILSETNPYTFGDSYYAELKDCKMTYDTNTKQYEFVWNKDLEFEKQMMN